MQEIIPKFILPQNILFILFTFKPGKLQFLVIRACFGKVYNNTAMPFNYMDFGCFPATVLVIKETI